MRQPAGAEQDGVGLLAQLDGRLRHRLAGVAIMAGACRRLGEAQRQAGRRRRDLSQHLERRRHHLRPDAVAGKHGDVEAVSWATCDRHRSARPAEGPKEYIAVVVRYARNDKGDRKAGDALAKWRGRKSHDVNSAQPRRTLRRWRNGGRAHAAGPALPAYAERPITVVVPFAAGGPTESSSPALWPNR